MSKDTILLIEDLRGRNQKSVISGKQRNDCLGSRRSCADSQFDQSQATLAPNEKSAAKPRGVKQFYDLAISLRRNSGLQMVMGKARKTKLKRAPLKPYSKGAQSKPKASSTGKPAPPPSGRPFTIPYESAHRILLVGEGDFSFSHSLLTTHGCSALVATCYDSRSALLEKYPQATENIKEIEAEEEARLLYSVDATKLNKAGKAIKRGGFHRIVFNFPHVGGLTKDVNRQVRHNQELLVGFFKSALPLLTPNGAIVITIFEGEPYTLWNVRDLARHVGFKIERSFKFEAKAYPGYKHARTLGNISGGGGWKGEDRPSRTYILEVRDRENGLSSIKQVGDGTSDDEDD